MKISLPTPVLADMAKADAIAGRVCDRRFRIEQDEQKVVNAFSIRFREEVAFRTDAATIPTSTAVRD